VKAIVKEIQVGGGHCVSSLEEACKEFMKMVSRSGETGYRAKLNFTIKLPNGEIKYITIRDDDNETVAYGDFEGLPSFLDYSKEVLGKDK
jgi:hypothetical protein